jgi:hypothetical protein
MDYNSYLMGVYGARNDKGLKSYHHIAWEMDLLHKFKVYGYGDYEAMPLRSVVCSSPTDIEKQIGGDDVRQIAIKHLREIWG